MDQQIRLECLRLAHRPGLSPHEVIATAREYLAWVDGVPGPTTARPGDGSKASKKAPSATDRTSPLTTAEQSAQQQPISSEG